MSLHPYFDKRQVGQTEAEEGTRLRCIEAEGRERGAKFVKLIYVNGINVFEYISALRRASAARNNDGTVAQMLAQLT